MSMLSHAPTSLDPAVGTMLRGTVADMLNAKGRTVHAIGPAEMVHAAISKMTEQRVGALVVMDGGALVGIVSERDYTRKGILQGRASKDTPVADIMSSQVVSVSPQTSLGECLEVVTRHHIRHLPVLDAGTVVGVLSIGDLVGAVVQQQAEAIQSLKAFIGSDYPT
jgi:CBS domain-containing protein